NSYGEEWGDGGYAWVDYDSLNIASCVWWVQTAAVVWPQPAPEIVGVWDVQEVGGIAPIKMTLRSDGTFTREVYTSREQGEFIYENGVLRLYQNGKATRCPIRFVRHDTIEMAHLERRVLLHDVIERPLVHTGSTGTTVEVSFVETVKTTWFLEAR